MSQSLAIASALFSLLGQGPAVPLSGDGPAARHARRSIQQLVVAEDAAPGRAAAAVWAEVQVTPAAPEAAPVEPCALHLARGVRVGDALDVGLAGRTPVPWDSARGVYRGALDALDPSWRAVSLDIGQGGPVEIHVPNAAVFSGPLQRADRGDGTVAVTWDGPQPDAVAVVQGDHCRSAPVTESLSVPGDSTVVAWWTSESWSPGGTLVRTALVHRVRLAAVQPGQDGDSAPARPAREARTDSTPLRSPRRSRPRTGAG